ncbi:hypothetical protein RchiOBHm_Chr7g0211181 [Rosa chinensis]|uniref:Uncharacterized protein n=1 Tax=Rosa chinensis TaxID=74649 RepID=A0A2P6PAE7_ROSCH|nr:hypothetical protein RchiOBHm_Chr7g0211181 [Rosa chinensis]
MLTYCKGNFFLVHFHPLMRYGYISLLDMFLVVMLLSCGNNNICGFNVCSPFTCE